MIETIVLNALDSALDVPVYMEAPEKRPVSYVIVQKTGSQRNNRIDSATIAVQSIAPTLQGAAELNESVKAIMDQLSETETDIFRAELNSDYNFTNTQTKERRYQAVYDITYKE